MANNAKTKQQVERLRFFSENVGMVRGIGSNVVDGPVSWRTPSADFRGPKKTDHFGPARLAEALVQGRLNKTMSVYYDKFDIPDHDCIFLNIASVLPAVLQACNLPWSETGDSS